MGGGKGGADFDPKGKSRRRGDAVLPGVHDRAVPPHRHRSPTCRRATSASAAARSASCSASTSGSATSSPACSPARASSWGGSLIRPEATGYGAVYFAEEMLEDARRDPRGQDVPGVGLRQRRAVHRREAARARRASPSRCPTRAAFIYDQDGIDREKLAWVMDLKNGAAAASASTPSSTERDVHLRRSEPTTNPLWAIPRRVRVPSAPRRTRSDAKDAAQPPEERRRTSSPRARTCRPTPEGVERFVEREGPVRPGQGGERRRRRDVAAWRWRRTPMRLTWPREEVDERLRAIMVEHPRELPRDRRGLRQAGQLRAGRQHRRLREGRRRDARAGCGVSLNRRMHPVLNLHPHDPTGSSPTAPPSASGLARHHGHARTRPRAPRH